MGSNTYRASFASAKALRDFRESFQVPDDVELELIPLKPKGQHLPGPNETVVPLFAICAALGSRFQPSPVSLFTP